MISGTKMQARALAEDVSMTRNFTLLRKDLKKIEKTFKLEFTLKHADEL